MDVAFAYLATPHYLNLECIFRKFSGSGDTGNISELVGSVSGGRVRLIRLGELGEALGGLVGIVVVAMLCAAKPDCMAKLLRARMLRLKRCSTAGAARLEWIKERGQTWPTWQRSVGRSARWPGSPRPAFATRIQTASLPPPPHHARLSHRTCLATVHGKSTSRSRWRTIVPYSCPGTGTSLSRALCRVATEEDVVSSVRNPRGVECAFISKS